MKRYLILLLILFPTIITKTVAMPDFADNLWQAETKQQTIPLISEWYPDISIVEAYHTQSAYINLQLVTKHISGFKAGLTNQSIQQRFSVDEAIAGVLFAEGRFKPGKLQLSQNYQKLMIETELGFIINQDINQPLTTLDEVKSVIGFITPIIELPEFAFTTPQKLKVVDIIAANVGARHYIEGNTKTTLSHIDPNAVQVTLKHNDTIISSGTGKDALQDQFHALLWLINKTIANGHTIKNGHLLITGALGKMVPGTHGSYEADYGETLGKIKFDIE